VQEPFVHDSPAAHTLPQAPQLFGSLESVTQMPLHAVVPAHDEQLTPPSGMLGLPHAKPPVLEP
jgi:hypothetical protein